MDSSKHGFCIGPEMKEEYEKRFKIKFSCMMNPVEKIIEDNKLLSSDVKKIVFMGGLHLGRLETLIAFLEELENANLIYEIEILAGELQSATPEPLVVKTCPFVPDVLG